MATIGVSASALAGEPASGGVLAAVGNGVSAAAPAASLEPETIAGTRMRVDWQRLISLSQTRFIWRPRASGATEPRTLNPPLCKRLQYAG